MFQIIALLVIGVLVAADRATKVFFTTFVAQKGAKEFLFGLFRITYTENRGAAFSSFSNNTFVLTVFTLAVIAGCLVFLLCNKKLNTFVRCCLVAIVAGGIGNVIDRIAKGFVVDFIEPLFMNFAVFNFADICITVGAFALLGYELVIALRDAKQKKTKTHSHGGNKNG